MPHHLTPKVLPGSPPPATGSDQPIRVLVVDDSLVARAALARIIDEAPGLCVAGLANGAAQARAWLEQDRADVVLLDLDMPVTGGLDVLPDLIAAGQGARVLVVSATAAAGAVATLRALALGAADTLEKPVEGLGLRFGKLLVERIARLGRVERVNADAFTLRARSSRPIGLLGIGASTGGIAALARFFNGLAPDFSAPILITQHLPPSFLSYFAAHVATMTRRPTMLAVDNAPLLPASIVIAPANAHLATRDGQIRMCHHGVATRHCPAVDPMFASIAAAGDRACVVVLSGMGTDGLDGATAVVAAGGEAIAQDAASSVVWGMPGSVARRGLASLIDTPEALAMHVSNRGSR